jgi:hypothetical protein
MKFLALLGMIFLSVACNDSMRNRLGACAPDDAVCLGGNALQVESFRSRLMAMVKADIMVSKSQLIFTSRDEDEERDTIDNFTCDLNVEEGDRFHYRIEKNALFLDNGITQMVLNRKSGSSNNLLGTWQMISYQGNKQNILTMEFKSLDAVTVIRNCNLK